MWPVVSLDGFPGWFAAARCGPPLPPMVSGLKALNFLCRLIGNQRKWFSCWRRCQRDVGGVGGGPFVLFGEGRGCVLERGGKGGDPFGRVARSFLEMGATSFFETCGSLLKGGGSLLEWRI
jgi:hypothetical protein